MAFNDSLDFAPSLAKLQGQSDPFHVILSGYLRSSKTFELYAMLEQLEGLNSRLIPFELKDDNSDRLNQTLRELLQLLRSEENFRSIMVSDPFKRTLHSLVDRVAERASECGAINVVIKEPNHIVGDNFDGEAFVAGAIKQCGITFEEKKIVFFGCGGVSRAVSARLAAVLSKIGLIDVNPDESQALATTLKLKNRSIAVEIIADAGERDLREYDYVYNGTGLGKSDNRSPIQANDRFNSSGIAFDANYTPSATPFLKHLAALGYRSINGLSHMLMCTSMHLSAVSGKSVSYETVVSAYERITHS